MSQKVKVKWDKERMIVEFWDGPKSKRSRVQEFKNLKAPQAFV